MGVWIENSAEDREKLREMEISGEMRGTNNNNISAVVGDLSDVQSISEAFDGCRGVFHTAGFIDPAGLAGYSVSLFPSYPNKPLIII